MPDYAVEIFKGLKNDEEQKHISIIDGFFYGINNFQYTDTGLVGMVIFIE